MTTVIVDYQSGNLHSAEKSFQRMSAESGKGSPVVVTSDPEAVLRAERIVLPGVGAFGDCRAGIQIFAALLATDGHAAVLGQHSFGGKKSVVCGFGGQRRGRLKIVGVGAQRFHGGPEAVQKGFVAQLRLAAGLYAGKVRLKKLAPLAS